MYISKIRNMNYVRALTLILNNGVDRELATTEGSFYSNGGKNYGS